MTTAEKLVLIAENEQKVHDAGYTEGVADQKAVSVDWDVIQNKGNRLYWTYAFAYWGYGDLNPKYMIKPSKAGGAQSMFQGSYIEKVDWSKFDFSECLTFYTAFNSCPFLVSIDADLTPTKTTADVWGYFCTGGQKLKRIQKMVAKLTHAYLNSFSGCKELEEIRFAPYDAEAGIGIGNDISFADSPKLTRESIESICMALANVEGKTLTFSTELGLESKLKPVIIGDGNYSFADGEKTENGVEFVLDTTYPKEIQVKGTATDEAIYNILNKPITISTQSGYGILAALYDDYLWLSSNPSITSSYLKMTVIRKNNPQEPEIVESSNDKNFGIYLENGDTIQSVDLVIPQGYTCIDEDYPDLCCPVLQFDYKYFTIDENMSGAKWWNIIY